MQILKFLKDLVFKLKFKDWLILLLAISALCFYISSRYYYQKSLNPVIVYNDSIQYYKNKLKEEYAMKNIYIQSNAQLKKVNTELTDEIKNLRDHPIVVTKTTTEIVIDTIKMQSDTIYIDPSNSIQTLEWHNSDDFFYIKGKTLVKNDFSQFQTIVDQLKIQAELTLDIIEKDNNLRMIAKSNNPYLHISNMDGVILTPSDSKVLKKYFPKKRWSIGPQVGIGISKGMEVSPYIGLGISYGFIQF